MALNLRTVAIASLTAGVLLLGLQGVGSASEKIPLGQGSRYFGIFPSILAEPEPYDYLDAIEVNLLPFVFEYRPLDRLGIQARPIANLRLIAGQQPVVSHVGGTVAVPWYRSTPWSGSHGAFVTAGPFTSYTYNLQDGISTVIVGGEIGTAVYLDPGFSLNFSLQPGINWYPRPLQGQYSFLPHIGLIIHFGWVRP
jgi:hypothetical protein